MLGAWADPCLLLAFFFPFFFPYLCTNQQGVQEWRGQQMEHYSSQTCFRWVPSRIHRSKSAPRRLLLPVCNFHQNGQSQACINTVLHVRETIRRQVCRCRKEHNDPVTPTRGLYLTSDDEDSSPGSTQKFGSFRRWPPILPVLDKCLEQFTPRCWFHTPTWAAGLKYKLEQLVWEKPTCGCIDSNAYVVASEHSEFTSPQQVAQLLPGNGVTRMSLHVHARASGEQS